MGISDIITDYILNTLNDQNEIVMKRSDIALMFNCVPSQINYVLATRFTPEHGYSVDSRRGGGGYIKIVRVINKNHIMHIVNCIGGEITLQTASAFVGNMLINNLIDQKSAIIIAAAISEKSLSAAEPETRNKLRANILKQILLNV